MLSHRENQGLVELSSALFLTAAKKSTETTTVHQTANRIMNRTARLSSGASSMNSKTQPQETERQNQQEFKKLKRLSPEDNIFPPIVPSRAHTVAVKVPVSYCIAKTANKSETTIVTPLCWRLATNLVIPCYLNRWPLFPKWEKEYVPMPCNPQNATTWNAIRHALTSPMNTVHDIASAIKKYNPTVGNLSVLSHTVNNVS